MGRPVQPAGQNSSLEAAASSGDLEQVARLLANTGVEGVRSSLRKKVWPLLLGSADEVYAKEEWQRLKREAQDLAKLHGTGSDHDNPFRRIAVDVVRHSPKSHPMFHGEARDAGLARLELLLQVHAVHDPDLGYVQGMSDRAAPFLHLYEEDWQAWRCFKAMLARDRSWFELDMQRMRSALESLARLLQAVDPELWRHLVEQGAEGCEFAFRMLLCCYTRELEHKAVAQLWEMLWAHRTLEAKQAKGGAGGLAQQQPPPGALAGPTGASGQHVPPSLEVACAAVLLQAERKALLRCGSPGELVVCVNGLQGPAAGKPVARWVAQAQELQLTYVRLVQRRQQQQKKQGQHGGAGAGAGARPPGKAKKGRGASRWLCGCGAPKAD